MLGKKFPVPILIVLLLTSGFARAEVDQTIDFNGDIRPILSDHCFACHGPDDAQRKAKLRLHTKEGLLGEVRGGGHVVVPGKSDESVLFERVSSSDPNFRMPPEKFNKPLKPEQIALLKQWIDEGANWSAHWAFVPPTLPEPPKVADSDWTRTPIDAFIRARLARAGLTPAPEADRVSLIRRLTLDLTGVPPTPEEVDDFVQDTSPDAYEKVVDRLLASPRFGEHMARYWLDAARYGDTHGLHLDNYREMWPYREWVINALNANKPFDVFLTEQLAGDLLPNPTLDQLVATGFLRCHVTTNEGGSIKEEVYVRNVVDRVDTNGTVLLGMSVGCARCHDHKYDPITQKEYYQLFAFFNSIDGNPMDGNSKDPPPVVKVPTEEQKRQLNELDQAIASLNKQIQEKVATIPYDDSQDEGQPEELKRREIVWIEDDLPTGAKPAGNSPWEFVTKPDAPVFSGEKAHRRSASGQSQHYFTGASQPLHIGKGDTLFAHVYIDPNDPPREIMLQWHSGEWKHRAYWGENLVNFGRANSPERRHFGSLPEAGKWVRLEVPTAKVGLKPGMTINGWAFTQHGGTVYWDKAGIVTATPQTGEQFDTLSQWVRVQRAAPDANVPKPIQEIIKFDRDKRNEDQRKQLRRYFIEHAYSKAQPILKPLKKELTALTNKRNALNNAIPTTLVFKELEKPKPAYFLNRGEYDQKRDEVPRKLPEFLPPMPEEAPMNRLGFAQWLTQPDHPLTARVAVNRFWQRFFGTGLVETSEDFGSQGSPPSHPQLLDWLAVRFVQDGWDVKDLIRQIVTSATYRQSAVSTPEKLKKDPKNRLLSRGPRYRLDAETLRDQALYVSGLLVERLGGPSVKPPQPDGLWFAVGYSGSNTVRFTADKGHEKVHRRSLYTFWKRTAPPPQMSAFDAPTREACTVRRERTNTPLQALLLLNDPQYVEAARGLAQRTLREAGPNVEDRVTYMFRLATSRRPKPQELSELATTFHDMKTAYREDTEAAQKLLNVGEWPILDSAEPAELAAWTMIANLVLNLDEVITK